MSKIITYYDPKPIPLRQFDWCATRDGYEPGDPIGYGRTQHDATQELLDEEEALLDAEDEMYAADCAYAESLEVDA